MPIVMIVLTVAALFGIGTYLLKPPAESTRPVTVNVVEETEGTTNALPNKVIVVDLPTTTPSSTKPAIKPTNGTITPVTPTGSSASPTPTPTPTPVATTTKFKSATYTATSDYNAPGRTNHIVAVTLTVKDDVVTNAKVAFSGDLSETSSGYQKKFTEAYTTQVVGKSLDTIPLSRVGGASLTTGAFNKGLTSIIKKARV